MTTEAHAKSPAFRRALLESEHLRIVIVLAAIGFAFLVRSLRTLIFLDRENVAMWVLSSSFLVAFCIYEILMLRAVNRATREDRDLSRTTIISNVIVETSVPAFALAFLTGPAIETAYRPLANPAVLIYFAFIILSTLRLEPFLSRFSGVVAAGSYLIAALYLGWRPTLHGGFSLLSPEKSVAAFAIIYVVAGVIAGAVTGEIRKHVNAALHEAEMQRQVERLEHDLDVARTIQQSLLPTSMPKIEGFEIAAWNQPADQTGGDYYDWQALPDGKVVLALADVTGHGIGPALLAAVCRAYARTNFNVDGDLMSSMERINASLSGDLGEGRFITFVAAICTPGKSEVELLSAGHGPLFVYTLRHDTFEAMKAHGLPLGISPKLDSDPPQILEMGPGDMLVLATDGFFEWANKGDVVPQYHQKHFRNRGAPTALRCDRPRQRVVPRD
ncbi:MAG: PP2C family protein-serine/threonine phosphatase [Candidatus Acidiferrales bacterium]